MRISDMNRNMVFQAPSGSPTVWTTIFTCKGALWPLSSAESVAAMSLNGSITGKVRIRWRPVKIRSNWRIVVAGSTTLSIVGPAMNLGGRSEYLEMKIKEVA